MNAKSDPSARRARWRLWILEWPRVYKRAILIAADFLLLSVALWLPLSLRYGRFYVPDTVPNGLLLFLAPLITLSIFLQIGLYRLVTRFIGYRGNVKIVLAVCLSVLIWSLIVFMSGQRGVPRTVIIGYGVLAAFLIAASRQLAGFLLESAGIRIPNRVREQPRKPALIYGAGEMGVGLLRAIRKAGDRQIVGFLEDSSTLWGQYVSGVKVYPASKIGRLMERTGAREILLALPGSQRRERRRILQELERYPIEVKVLPAYEDIAAGRVGVSDLRPVDIGDLLGRDTVQPNTELLARNTHGKSILVTGAGGSIGSELVRQIVKLGPRRVVLLEVSEIALYTIEIEIAEAVAAFRLGCPQPEIKPILGSVLDNGLIHDVIAENRIDTIYHAAAYKHVPIVEHNPIVGLENNLFGALVVAQCARRLGVERMVLISTDKAVRPTNIMGASKRLAELVLQAEAADASQTVFTMVRFGNVLDSSGSVVRRFRKQIRKGGPVTVTHPEITRYFMSIPEAAELVIQAGAMAKGGEVFVLHMGEAVKIAELARHMIHLSGLEVLDEHNPQGDIAITYTGLRAGEKLYEELLLGAHAITTEHPRIYKSEEPFLSSEELKRELDLLKAAMAARDRNAIQAILARTVEGYRPYGEAGEAAAQASAGAVSRTLH